MKKAMVRVEITESDSGMDLTKIENELIGACIKAADNAWAPYSGFKVGAAVLLENGVVVSGSNQENAAYPSGLCAERVAIFSAHNAYPEHKIIMLAVCAKKNGVLLSQPVAPCGSCRQVIAESNQRFGSAMKLIMHGSEKTLTIDDSNQLLPLAFNSGSL